MNLHHNFTKDVWLFSIPLLGLIKAIKNLKENGNPQIFN